MKINIKNKGKVEEAIKAAEGNRVSARTIIYDDVINMVSKLEAKLSTLLFKKDWTGLRFFCDPNAQTFPSSYNGTPESTTIVIERKSSGWFIFGISRSRCERYEIDPMNIETKSKEIADYLSQAKNW